MHSFFIFFTLKPHKVIILHTTSNSHTPQRIILTQHFSFHKKQSSIFTHTLTNCNSSTFIIINCKKINKNIINLFTHPSNQEAYQIQHHNLSFSFRSWSRLELLPYEFYFFNTTLSLKFVYVLQPLFLSF